MRNLIVGALILLSVGCASVQINEIDQKLDKQNGKEIVLVKVVDDSRCPEGVTCIWAGQAVIEVAAYEDNQIVDHRRFEVNEKNRDVIKEWFTLHLPPRKEPLKEIRVAPYPKEGVLIKPEEYKVILD